MSVEFSPGAHYPLSLSAGNWGIWKTPHWNYFQKRLSLTGIQLAITEPAILKMLSGNVNCIQISLGLWRLKSQVCEWCLLIPFLRSLIVP
jgi:hypothetical protein